MIKPIDTQLSFQFDKRPAKTRLLEWLRDRRCAKTSEIILWGTQNYSNRSDRNARLLATEGYIRRMTEDETNFHYGKIREEAWIVL